MSLMFFYVRMVMRKKVKLLRAKERVGTGSPQYRAVQMLSIVLVNKHRRKSRNSVTKEESPL
jgi:hypothetical protein